MDSCSIDPGVEQLSVIKKQQEQLLQSQYDVEGNVCSIPSEAFYNRVQRSRQVDRDVTGMAASLTSLYELLQQAPTSQFGYAKINTLILKTSLLVHQSLSSIINYLPLVGEKGNHLCFDLLESKHLTRLRLYDHDIGRNLAIFEGIKEAPVLTEEQRKALLELGNGLSTFTRYLSGDEPMAQKLKKCAFLSHCQECAKSGFYKPEDEELIQKYWGNIEHSKRAEFFDVEMKRLKDEEFLPIVSEALEAVKTLLMFAVLIRI